MNISVPLGGGRQLFARIEKGQVMGLKSPTITDYNEYPGKCAYFASEVAKNIKLQRASRGEPTVEGTMEVIRE